MTTTPPAQTFKARRSKAGLHLFDRRSGVNILVDEIKYEPSELDLAPAFVSFALTNACDLDCPYCYAPKHGARLPVSSVEAWCNELDAHGTLGIGFGGGEPTIYPHLPDLCDSIRNNTRLAISMTTHGHHLSGPMLDRLSTSIDFVRVSVDGVGATYESLRGRPFSAVDTMLTQLASRLPFGINCVVTNETLPQLDDVLQFARRKGARQLTLLPEIRGGTLALSARDIMLLEQWVETNRQSFPLAMSDLGSEAIQVAKLDTGEDQRSFMHVDADGHLKSSAFASKGVPIRQFDGIIDAVRHFDNWAKVVQVRVH